MEVVEVFAIESSKDKHTATQKASAVASSSLWSFPIYFEVCYLVLFWIQNQNVTQIVAKSPSIDVYFILVNS